MTYTTDNRWSTGSGRDLVPEDAPAAYGARWIDYGSRAETVPDRQGFACNDRADRDWLVAFLEEANLTSDVHTLEHDVPRTTDEGGWSHVMRRSGGYIYVDAWLNPEGS